MITVVSWNMDGNSDAWDLLLSMGTDIALLQDPGVPNDAALAQIEIPDPPWDLRRRRRPPVVARLSDRVQVGWLSPVKVGDTTTGVRNTGRSQIAVSDPLTIAAARVAPHEGEPFTVVSMYGRWLRAHPAVRASSRLYSDASVHRILSDLSAFTASRERSGHRVLASGDLNLIYDFAADTDWRGRSRTRAVWDRFDALGLEFLGPQHPNGRLAAVSPAETSTATRNVPTYYSRDGAASGVNVKTPLDARNQLDYVFASHGFHESIRARALNGVEEWGPSDHCRILIEIDE